MNTAVPFFLLVSTFLVNRVVSKVAKQNNQPKREWSALKAYAVLLGLAMQFATCTVVFGFIGYFFARKWHHPWVTLVGVFVGLGIGASNFLFFAKQMLGDNS